jgi:hypothetical protein
VVWCHNPAYGCQPSRCACRGGAGGGHEREEPGGSALQRTNNTVFIETIGTTKIDEVRKKILLFRTRKELLFGLKGMALRRMMSSSDDLLPTSHDSYDNGKNRRSVWPRIIACIAGVLIVMSAYLLLSSFWLRQDSSELSEDTSDGDDVIARPLLHHTPPASGRECFCTLRAAIHR